ncbi:MAG TPA: TIGR03086 family metal-binding protein [Acidimicrobiales bacterium]|nr:TIGR03086 family metal-binding protein [Acidimicrobiales bacterium]
MTIEKTVLVPLDANETFALLTEPERLRRWQLVSARMDLRAGGDFRWTVVPGANASGTFEEVEPGKRLVYTWGWETERTEMGPEPGASTITITLEPAEGGTTVRLVHEGLTPEQDEAHSHGWDHFMGRLVAAAKDGSAELDPMLQRPAESWDPLTSAEASLAVCEYVLAQMGPGDGKAQTPCSEYDVDQLAEHLCGSLVSLGGCVGVQAAADMDATLEVRVADLGQKVLEGWRRHGLEGEVTLGPGPFPAETACGILSMEFLVHAWDFARATGHTVPANDGLSTYVLGLAHGLIRPSFRGEGQGFGAELPAGAGSRPMEQLLAFTGRQP